MKESYFKNRLVSIIRSQSKGKIWIYCPKESIQRGVPDVLIVYDSNFYALELKVHPYKPTDIQKFILKSIYDAGEISCVITYMKGKIKINSVKGASVVLDSMVGCNILEKCKQLVKMERG